MIPKLSFQIRLFIYLVVLFFLLLSMLAVYYYIDLDRQLYEDLGRRAKIQAEEISVIPDLKKAVEQNNIAAINHLMTDIVHHSDASFVVIGDKNAVHLYHSRFADRVGKTLVGGDNHEVLQGKSIISIRQGGIGISLRSKAPILDAHGRVIGLVSVGYLTSLISDLTLGKVLNILVLSALLLVGLFVFSWFFSRSIKKQMFSLEPQQIGVSGAAAKGPPGVNL